jgi:hypothetical protein
MINLIEPEEESMNRLFASAFLVLGLALSLIGYFTYLGTLSTGSESGTIYATPTDTTVWLVIFGLLSAITGAYGFATKDSDGGSRPLNRF